jgi:Large ribosomal RNA subunit accumulation protein YceD
MTEERAFSRLVRVDALPREGQVVTIEATPAEREELASFYGLPAIAALTATLRLHPWGQGGARVTGAVHAELTQVCVVSLEPFPATVDEDVDVRFAPQTAANSRSKPIEETQTFSLADEDEPDPVIDGKIDLGALTAELFALGLDPYPRKPDAVLEERSNSEPTNSPFAALAQRGKAGSD